VSRNRVLEQGLNFGDSVRAEPTPV
jgi:hypothetical protein